MCMTATAVKDVVLIERYEQFQGVSWVAVAIDAADPYGSFKKLPNAIEYLGKVLGKSAYDSDKNLAFYRSDVQIAKAIRKS